MLELCQIVEDFLSKNNKPPEGSFHDGMLREKAAAEHEIKVLFLLFFTIGFIYRIVSSLGYF